MRHCEVHDDAKDNTAVPVDALRAFEEALNVLAVHGEFVGRLPWMRTLSEWTRGAQYINKYNMISHEVRR